MEFENLSASYDVGIAKKYGINCAVFLNKLMYLSKYTSREDGFCWKTTKEFEDELGLTRHQQELVIRKLVEENIIEVKNTFIIGTQTKCKHFKIIKNYENDKCDLPESGKSEMLETGKSVNNNKTLILKENNKKKSYGEFKNVLLSDEEYDKLKNSNLLEYIETLSAYIESTGRKYKNHYATILNWSRKEKKEKPKKPEVIYDFS